MSADRLMKLCLLFLFAVCLLFFIDIAPMDEDVVKTAEAQEAMARTCTKSDGILVGLKSLFLCDSAPQEDR